MIQSIFIRILKSIGRAANHTIITHDGIEHAGYLAFLGLLSLFPFLVFIIAVTGFLGDGELGREFIITLRDILPQQAEAIILPRINEILDGPPRGLLTFSMLAAVWTASSAVEGYRTVLNRAYRVGTPPAYIWRRLLSILQLLIFIGILLTGMLTLLLAPPALHAVSEMTGIDVSYSKLSWNLQLASGFALFCMVSLIYYSLPNIKQTLSAVIPGALMTIGLWALAVKGIQLYLETFDQVSVIYGSLGGIIAVLLFFYVINVIFIFGAEFNFQLMRSRGNRVEEKEATH